MKKKFLIGGLVIVFIAFFVSVGYFTTSKTNKNDNTKENNSNENLKELPLPEVTGGTRGELGIDKNINEQTIDEYLNRSDSVYRDMRLLDDPGNYESIGGDSKLSGYIKGFEVIPLPYIIPVSGLPESVGNTYQGETLFSLDSNGNYIANYEESMSIIEKYFPKDKYIFLMCGGGGYAGMMKKFLVSLGWDTNKIYNIGGYWYYDGKNNVEVKKVTDNKVTYDFDSVPYIDIDFSKLHKLKNSNSNQNSNSNSNKVVSNSNVTSNSIKSNSNKATSNSNTTSKVVLDSIYYNVTTDKTVNKEFAAINLEQINDKCREIDVDNEPEAASKCYADLEKGKTNKANVINKLINKKSSFIVSVSPGDVCSAGGPDILSQLYTFSEKYHIYYYKISMGVFEKTKLYNKNLKYAPTIIIVNKGKVVAYTDPNSDISIKLTKNYSDFEKWIKKYVVIK